MLYLTQAFVAEFGRKVPLKLGILTSGIECILGTEFINPVNASLTGACRVIMQEHPKIRCKIFDLNPLEQPLTNTYLINRVLASCTQEDWDEVSLLASLRNDYQWSLAFTPLSSRTKTINRLKDKGVYLLTGGLGSIALSCCEAIAKTIANPTFILLSRKEILDESEWAGILTQPHHNFYKIINQLDNLKKKGAFILTYQVDITDYQRLEEVVQKCLVRVGQINGLIHTAGISQPELVEHQLPSKTREVFKAKLQGTYHLIRVLQPLSLDFTVLTSSLESPKFSAQNGL